MACDICGKKGTRLSDLLDCHKTTDVHQVCGECEAILNKHKSKLQSVTSRILIHWMRRFIDELRAKRGQPR